MELSEDKKKKIDSCVKNYLDLKEMLKENGDVYLNAINNIKKIDESLYESEDIVANLIKLDYPIPYEKYNKFLKYISFDSINFKMYINHLSNLSDEKLVEVIEGNDLLKSNLLKKIEMETDNFFFSIILKKFLKFDFVVNKMSECKKFVYPHINNELKIKKDVIKKFVNIDKNFEMFYFLPEEIISDFEFCADLLSLYEEQSLDLNLLQEYNLYTYRGNCKCMVIESLKSLAKNSEMKVLINKTLKETKLNNSNLLSKDFLIHLNLLIQKYLFKKDLSYDKSIGSGKLNITKF